MAKNKSSDKDKGQDDLQAEAVKSVKKKWFKALLTRKRIITIIAGTILIHTIGLLYFGFRRGGETQLVSPEVSLGEFEFIAKDDDASTAPRAKFQLHISLLKDVDQTARVLLLMNKFKLQQDIEELMRRAHAGDFADPSLGELKRQIQATVNQTLGKRVVEQVIVTDLIFDQVAAVSVDRPHGEALQGNTKKKEDSSSASVESGSKKKPADPGWKEKTPS